MTELALSRARAEARFRRPPPPPWRLVYWALTIANTFGQVGWITVKVAEGQWWLAVILIFWAYMFHFQRDLWRHERRCVRRGIPRPPIPSVLWYCLGAGWTLTLLGWIWVIAT